MASVRGVFVEPFYGGSHKAFLDGLSAHSSHEIHLLSLPDGEWRRRMRRGAQELAAAARALPGQFDFLIVSDMLDLPAFLALTRPRFERVPVMAYFHENQMTYPRLKGTKFNSWFGQINYLSARWLDQVRWLDGKAVECQRRYYRTRRSILVCSALVPVLLGAAEGYASLRIAAGGLSLVVTLAAGWEAFFRYGDRWRHYRAIAERLRREGWLYIERSGPYADYPSHARAHAAFVLNAEQILADDVEQFVSRIAAEPQRGQSSG